MGSSEHPIDPGIRAEVDARLTGEFQFGLVKGDLDGRVDVTNGVVRLEFSWSGFDENDPISGRGWMQVGGDQAEGCIFIHLGGDSAFTAVRQNSKADELVSFLQQGDDEVAQGKVKPVAEVVKRLRTDRQIEEER